MNILSIRKIYGYLDKVLAIIKQESVGLKSMIEVNQVARFSAGTIITGVLSCRDNCYFDGKMHGDIEVQHKLVLGENSEMSGNIYSGDLMVKGKMNGNVKVQRKTLYCNTSIITSESVETGFLEVESGAILNLSNLSMQVTESTMLSFASANGEYSSIIDNNRKMRKNDRSTNIKANPAIGSINNNDDTFLFQFFQDKNSR